MSRLPRGERRRLGTAEEREQPLERVSRCGTEVFVAEQVEPVREVFRAGLEGPEWGKADSLWWNAADWHLAAPASR